MKKTNDIIESELLDTPGVVNISIKKPFEIRRGIFSSIYINIKNTLPIYHKRYLLAEKMAEYIDPESDYICGMESGGTYFASVIGDILKKPVIFFRKKENKYKNRGRIAGSIPVNGSLIAIVDDVLASGLTKQEAVNFLRALGCRVKIYSIFSFGFDEEISKKLGIQICSLSNFKNLCKIASKKKILTPADIAYLTKQVKEYHLHTQSDKSNIDVIH